MAARCSGLTTLTGKLLVIHSAFPVIEAERTSTGTTFALGALAIKGTSSGDISDGFGAGIQFTFEDTGGTFTSVGAVEVVRAGADDTTDIVWKNAVAGSLTEKARLTSAGRFTSDGVQVPPSSAGEPENCATAVLGASYYDTSDNMLCFCVEDGTDTEWVLLTDPTHTGHCSI